MELATVGISFVSGAVTTGGIIFGYARAKGLISISTAVKVSELGKRIDMEELADIIGTAKTLVSTGEVTATGLQKLGKKIVDALMD